MDFANFTMVPKWVLVLTKAKLLGHNKDSTKPPQWLAMGPKRAKGKTNLLRCCALTFAFTLACPHTQRQRECVRCVNCECSCVFVYVFCVLRLDLLASSRTSGVGFSLLM
jgi:hypothetical protein